MAVVDVVASFTATRPTRLEGLFRRY